MKKSIVWIILYFIFSASILAAEDIYDQVIRDFREKKFLQAARQLENIKEKNAKIYYFLGLTYFKAGNKVLARRYFLYSYYLEPVSRWGRASYKNNMYIRRHEWYFFASVDMGYDSNVTYLTEEFMSNEAGSLFAGIYWSSSFRVSTYGTLQYSYKRNEYLGDNFQDEDKHSLAVMMKKYTDKISATCSYSTLAGDYFYTTLLGKYSGRFFNIGIMYKDYDGEYSYLDGYELSLSLYKKIFSFFTAYTYVYNNVNDFDAPVYYQYEEAGTDSDIYDFESIAAEEKYFLSLSYHAHCLETVKSVVLGKKISLKLIPAYTMKLFNKKNRLYYNYWLKDPDTGSYYYYNDGEWVYSSSMPPGEAVRKNRIDSKFSMKLGCIWWISKYMNAEIYYKYESNISNMTNKDIYDYNWNKNTSGLRFSYKF